MQNPTLRIEMLQLVLELRLNVRNAPRVEADDRADGPNILTPVDLMIRAADALEQLLNEDVRSASDGRETAAHSRQASIHRIR